MKCNQVSDETGGELGVSVLRESEMLELSNREMYFLGLMERLKKVTRQKLSSCAESVESRVEQHILGEAKFADGLFMIEKEHNEGLSGYAEAVKSHLELFYDGMTPAGPHEQPIRIENKHSEATSVDIEVEESAGGHEVAGRLKERKEECGEEESADTKAEESARGQEVTNGLVEREEENNQNVPGNLQVDESASQLSNALTARTLPPTTPPVPPKSTS
ncbi:hypothetical protein B0J14DRAFT_565405 [Halenospora varia]|nr:hypothetical protein B0J14DRAFT_565405 [Halenospora varia]